MDCVVIFCQVICSCERLCNRRTFLPCSDCSRFNTCSRSGCILEFHKWDFFNLETYSIFDFYPVFSGKDCCTGWFQHGRTGILIDRTNFICYDFHKIDRNRCIGSCFSCSSSFFTCEEFVVHQTFCTYVANSCPWCAVYDWIGNFCERSNCVDCFVLTSYLYFCSSGNFSDFFCCLRCSFSIFRRLVCFSDSSNFSIRSWDSKAIPLDSIVF